MAFNPAPTAPDSRAKAERRSGGILLHPTSFPGPYGIGEIGDNAYRFIEFLDRAGQRLWQILPLSPTGYGDSPYSSFSAFAGNPLMISLDHLAREGLISEEELAPPGFPEDSVDFGPVIEWKTKRLEHAFQTWREKNGPSTDEKFLKYVKENDFWLEGYVLFMAIKEDQEGRPWTEWPAELRDFRSKALSKEKKRLSERTQYYRFLQWTFSRQWFDLKNYANSKGIRILGDVPIFVAHDSADVWAAPELFYLDDNGNPFVVAGVPPDYFSETGQLWGNPLYRWDVMQKDGYAWWKSRFRAAGKFVDAVRLDHFRGFEAYWEIPGDAETAQSGKWVKGPGLDFFNEIKAAFPEMELIAEDLGLITLEVEQLREAAGLPGMKVMQFAFSDDATNPFLPHNFEPNCVAYTGTHDNDTTEGWYATVDETTRSNFWNYVGGPVRPVHRELIRQCYSSVAKYAVVPLQDVFGLGTEARMNFPGKQEGNWSWRYRSEALTPQHESTLRSLAQTYGRLC